METTLLGGGGLAFDRPDLSSEYCNITVVLNVTRGALLAPRRGAGTPAEDGML